MAKRTRPNSDSPAACSPASDAGVVAQTASAEPPALELPSSLDLSTATQIKAALLERVASAATPVLDFTRVERLTTPGAQLVLAGGLAAERNGGSFSIVNVSPEIAQAFRDLGLAKELERWKR